MGNSPNQILSSHSRCVDHHWIIPVFLWRCWTLPASLFHNFTNCVTWRGLGVLWELNPQSRRSYRRLARDQRFELVIIRMQLSFDVKSSSKLHLQNVCLYVVSLWYSVFLLDSEGKLEKERAANGTPPVLHLFALIVSPRVVPLKAERTVDETDLVIFWCKRPKCGTLSYIVKSPSVYVC